MVSKEIESNILPQLNGTAKDLINNGIWFLYTLDNPPVKDAKYCLVADKTYILDTKGSILNVPVSDKQAISYKDRLLFSDLPKTIVQENDVIRWA